LERFGSLPFAELARPALRFARDGFVPSAAALARLERARDLYLRSDEWQAVDGRSEPGRPLVQSDLARTIEALCANGPEVYYRGAIGAAIADHVRSLGGLMEREDLAEHRGDWIEPLRIKYRGVEVLELP